MVKLLKSFNLLKSHKVAVIGDFLLDSYTIGKASRISPEAPVAVVHVKRQEHRPGGAGNVILNLISMGCQVAAIGRIGKDESGKKLVQALNEEDVQLTGFFEQENFATPIKNRIIADHQQVVRIDHEEIKPLCPVLEEKILAALPEILSDVKVIAISDYGKGFLSKSLLQAVIQAGKEKGIPVIADPKGIDFSKYAGATIIKPNLAEAYAAVNLSLDAPLELAASKILEITKSEVLILTRSEAGISLFYSDGARLDFPVRVQEVKDVTGAGDTVLAMIACALANQLDLPEAVQLANVAAGLAIERFGCARIPLSDLARRLLDYDLTHKVFDEEHLFTLLAALKNKKFAILTISETEEITPRALKQIKQLAEKEEELLVYIKEAVANEEFMNLLASLCGIDFILTKEESIKKVCLKLDPKICYSLKGCDVQELAFHPEALVKIL